PPSPPFRAAATRPQRRRRTTTPQPRPSGWPRASPGPRRAHPDAPHAARSDEPPAAGCPLAGAALVRRLVSALALLALLAVNLRWAEPYYNWDMLGYIGVAERLGGATPAEAHRRAYDLAYRVAPPEQYAWLVEGGAYQQAVAADPAAFEQQLPFYRVKPAYPLLMLGLDRLGLDPARGSVWISRIAYLGIGVVAFVWLASFLSPFAALATAWGIMSVQVALDAAQLSTPDALSTVVVLTALWLVFERQNFGRGVLLLLLSLAIRPDNLLWLLAVAAW